MVLTVVLENFKCYVGTYVYSFSDEHAITLISGDSGAGKSTIFTAVAWALYGKEKRTTPWSNKKTKKSSVKVEIADGIIFRQKNPERLTVTDKACGKVMTQDEAQHWITAKYGERDVWLASSYLSQNDRSIFLQGTNAEKLQLLERWLFSQDLPSMTIDKIIARRKKAQDAFDQSSAVMSRLESTTLCLPDGVSKEDIHLVTTERIAELKQWIHDAEQVQAESEAYQQWMSEGKMLQSQLDELQSQCWSNDVWSDYQKVTQEWEINYQAGLKFDELDRQIDPSRRPDTTRLDQLETSRVIAEQRQEWIQTTFKMDYTLETVQSLQSRLSTVIDSYGLHQLCKGYEDAFSKMKTPSISTDVPPASDAELQAVKIQTSAWQTMMQMCKSLNVTSDELPALRLELERYLTVSSFIQAFKNWSTLLSQPKIETTYDMVKTAQAELSDAIQAEKLLTCPQCQCSLRLENQMLVHVARTSSSSIPVSKLRMKVAQLESAYEWTQERDKWASMWKSSGLSESEFQWALKHPRFSTISDIRLWASKVQSIVVVERPIHTWDELNYHATWCTTRDNLLKSQKEVQGLDRADPWYNEPLSKLQGWKAKLNEPWIAPVPWSKVELRTWRALAELESQWPEGVMDVDVNALEQRRQACQAQLTVRGRFADIQRRLNDWKARGASMSEKPRIDPTEWRNELERALTILPWKKEQERLAKARAERDECETALKQWIMLGEKAKWLEHHLLSSTIDAFNDTLNTILGDIFDNQMMIFLEMFKGDRPSIQLKMVYRGMEDESVDDLSGGELDRVSLALTLCLAIHSSWPVVMLDESMNSLDAETRERCLDMIRRMIPTKRVLVISHDDSEPIYDTMKRVASYTTPK